MNAQDNMIAFAREALGLSETASVRLSPLQGRGSDRTFYRLKWNRTDTAILVHYDPKRLENAYYADIASFLRSISVSAPLLIRHDPVQCLVLLEDLGDADLWSLREAPWETRRTLYQKTLTTVHRLHAFPEHAFPWDRVKLMPGFGPELYSWERNYFRDHFISHFCGIELESSMGEQLERELSDLADRLSGTKRSLVHRDLQSQNVMIRDGEPFLIDFQGMRFGTPFYDLGSLFCDPYVRFADEERDELLLFYYALSKQVVDWSVFQTHFWEASVQRLMQALGAFGFLGLQKGLRAFLDHIPAGLLNLLHACERTPGLARLRELCQACHMKMGQKGQYAVTRRPS